MSYLLDPNFYASIPLWIYITGGFGVIILINSSVLCCFCCKIQRRKKELDFREIELQRRENQFARKVKIDKKERQYETEDIIISKPMKYEELSH